MMRRISWLLVVLMPGATAGVYAQGNPSPSDPNKFPPVPKVASVIDIVCDADLVTTDFVCGNGLGPFTTPEGGILNPDDFEYYRGTCTPGDPVVIEIFRTTSDMDPAAHACEGDLCGISNAGWGSFACPPGVNLLAEGDDEGLIPCGVGGDFSDPRLDFICPAGGVFTLAVYDNMGAGPNPEFEIHASGVALPNQAPTVIITAPPDGSTFTEGDPITFSGTATDPEDGDISTNLSWVSDLDGMIGSGATFTTTLSAGTHTITASVTDSGGLSDSDSITVNVLPPAPIPTMGPGALAIAAVLMVGIGLLLLRRRRLDSV